MSLISNPTRCHGNNRDLSSIESENNYSRNQAGVHKTECVSVLVENTQDRHKEVTVQCKLTPNTVSAPKPPLHYLLFFS